MNFRLNGFAVFALFLASCTSVPLTSLPSLALIDFKTTDIAKIRVAISYPKNYALKRPPAFLKITYQIEGEEEHEKKLFLEETREPAELLGLPDSDVEAPLHVFRLPPESAAELAKLRDDEIERAKSDKKKGSMSVGLQGNFCKQTEPPPGPVWVNTYISTIETAGWVTLTSNLDLRREKAAAIELAKMEICK